MSKPITLCYKICYVKSFYSKNVCLAFVETLKVGSWKHIEHISVIMTFVQTTFVLVIFVHMNTNPRDQLPDHTQPVSLLINYLFLS